jgi:hypothetical protein
MRSAIQVFRGKYYLVKVWRFSSETPVTSSDRRRASVLETMRKLRLGEALGSLGFNNEEVSLAQTQIVYRRITFLPPLM